MAPPQPGGVYCDLTSLSTLAGQNTSPPSEKIFNLHFIVKPLIGGSGTGATIVPNYVDPSYGRFYNDGADFEGQAVYGYFDLLQPVGVTSGGDPIFSVTRPDPAHPNITITP